MKLTKRQLAHKCGTDLHFKNHAGLLVYELRGRMKVYSAYCPDCNAHETIQVKASRDELD